MCAWCCAEEPCPYGHSKEWEERVEPPTDDRPLSSLSRHRTGTLGDTEPEAEMEIAYLDWTDP